MSAKKGANSFWGLEVGDRRQASEKAQNGNGSYWKKLAWIWVWRHVRLGLAPRRLGIDGHHADSQRY